MDPNPQRAERDWPAAVVAGASQTGVVLMRDLARRGVSVCCVGQDPKSNGFRTVYGKGYLCPKPDVEPAAWVAFMSDLAKKVGGRPVLMATADQFVSAIGEHADELGDSFCLSKQGVALQARLGIKDTQYDLVSRYGMPLPRTRTIGCIDEVIEFGSGARFPCLLKPNQGLQWESGPQSNPLRGAKVVVVDSPEELAAQYRVAAELRSEVVVQEVIEGPDTAKLVYLSCYSTAGDRIGHCMLRELRTCPKDYGSASVVEPLLDPEADSLAINLGETRVHRIVRDRVEAGQSRRAVEGHRGKSASQRIRRRGVVRGRTTGVAPLPEPDRSAGGSDRSRRS